MSWQIAEEHYKKALKLGQKTLKERLLQNKNPYPLVLDQILSDGWMDTAQYIGFIDVPVNRIVGTKSPGRTTAFTADFLPLLDEESEFAAKWTNLCCAHLGDEGIRDPILCYEYLGDFYVQEGNKRLSVLRYFEASRIPSIVYRVMPTEADSRTNRTYFEFLNFYKHAKLYDIQFSAPGSYLKFLSHIGFESDHDWNEDERRRVRAYTEYFRVAFHALGGEKLQMNPEDALLLWLQFHPFTDLGRFSSVQLKKSLGEIWENIVSLDSPDPMIRTEAPATEAKPTLFSILSRHEHINVAFIHQRTIETSPWTQAHDIGRQHLENTLGKAVTVRSYFKADTPVIAEEIIETAVSEGAEVIFTTTPQLIDPCLKVSVRYPKVRFLNCSVHMPFSSVHTYYSRIYEGKFITGAIAGAIADNNRIGYVGSYPIFGVPASINAFALGAQLTNPRATIELKWSCLPGNPTQEFLNDGIWVISNRDNPIENQLFTEYGTFSLGENGQFISLGSPCWLWGKFYENVVRSILAGTWDINQKNLAINDWWGMSSGVIDVTLANDLPEGIKTIANILREGIKSGTIDPFKRKIIAQDGRIINDGTISFLPDDLLHIDWLCENVHGSIPRYKDILPISRPTVRMLGIYRDEIPAEEALI